MVASLISQKLHNYYHQMGIHPLNFQCSHAYKCRRFAYQGNMTETKMSMVGSLYGMKYPKILYVTLDPPSTVGDVFNRPEQRTSEYVANFSENEDFEKKRPNTHWAMINILTKDILTLWGYKGGHKSAVVSESYANRSIDNMVAYYAHVNITKCSMNNPGRAQSARQVHYICSKEYLLEELPILEPDIMISQGADTNRILGKMLIDKEILENDLPKAEEIHLRGRSVLWLPMHIPVRQLNKVRDEWPVYVNFIKSWCEKS